ncbi:MAG: hypothetical protein RQ756_10050, partial [Flavobacteriaceae bacterium]|nr:hypothetical protein [Flavobacteriaceae bacterium]
QLTPSDSTRVEIHQQDTLIRLTPKESKKLKLVPFKPVSQDFFKQYLNTVFETEEARKTKRLRYWKIPIKVYFSPEVDRRVKQNFRSFAEQLNTAIDSLDIEIVTELKASNFIIYYPEKDFDYEVRLNNTKSIDYYVHWDNTSIIKGFIKANPEYFIDKEQLSNMINKYFWLSLGRFYAQEKHPCESYFSNCIPENALPNDLDLEIMRYHYSYNFCGNTAYHTMKERFNFILKHYQSTY